jgi:3-dehydroquinate dehydratase / shikimate dehydrogenase
LVGRGAAERAQSRMKSTAICVSLTEETTAGVIDRMVDLAEVADLFEVRADYVLDLDLLTLLRARTRPILLTCRSASQGGRFPDQDPGRRLILLEAVKRGFDYVDVEHDSGFYDVMLEKTGRGLVVSHHDFEQTPEDLDGLYGRMAEQGADVVKIAVAPRSVADLGRLLAFAARTAGKGGPPLVALALGPLGMASRVLAGRYGAPFTFASPERGAEAAAGQIPAAEMAELYRVREVTAATGVYGVLGSDVAHSLSPVLHNRAFAARGLDAVYVPLCAEALPPFLEALPALGLSGFSVTRPYKVEMLPHLHEVDEAVTRCGSVNTVLCAGGRLRGLTTDGAGVLGPLGRRTEVKGRAAVILGAGGAARAAAFALRTSGAKVTVLARNADQAGELAGLVGCAHGALADLARHPWDILINATPLGSRAFPDETPVPADRHRPGSIVFDMTYDPLETRLLREASAAGCTIVDGLEMLLAQAVQQFEAWTGMEAPLDAMKTAAIVAVQERA